MNMDSRRAHLTCEGLSIGRCRVPAFAVHAGELVKLEFPYDRIAEQRTLLRALGTPGPQGPIRATGQVLIVEKPRNRSSFLEMFHRQRAVEWLCAQARIPLEEALPCLQRVNLSPDTPIASMAGTPRKVLGILAALLLRADTIVFDTEGLDPLGVRDALRAVAGQLGDSSALYLTRVDDIDWPEIKFAAVHPVNEPEAQHTMS
jgi:hypothetical protein